MWATGKRQDAFWPQAVFSQGSQTNAAPQFRGALAAFFGGRGRRALLRLRPSWKPEPSAIQRDRLCLQEMSNSIYNCPRPLFCSLPEHKRGWASVHFGICGPQKTYMQPSNSGYEGCVRRAAFEGSLWNGTGPSQDAANELEHSNRLMLCPSSGAASFRWPGLHRLQSLCPYSGPGKPEPSVIKNETVQPSQMSVCMTDSPCLVFCSLLEKNAGAQCILGYDGLG